MSKRVYGIDLGTTYSCIAYVDEHGKPVVVPNAEGQQTTPSVVYFESGDNVVVGGAAKEVALVHRDRVVSAIKRQMGDPNYQFGLEGKSYRPQEISAHILRKLVKDAATITGDKIEDVVITCPAYFGVTQKEATKQAGIIAGLNVLYVIPEPTAAAVAYGIEQTNEQNILVYDLGGGTFDITLIRISAGEIAVIATGGDDQLGGKDWDDDIVGYMARAFEVENGTPAKELLDDMDTYQELMTAAEKAKINLSSAKSVTQLVRFGSGRAKIELTRNKFDEITSPRLERTVSLTEEMLERARNRGVARIDKLLLVGGSTYMPQVLERMKHFPFELLQYDPNQAVAKGAAVFGFRCELEAAIKSRVAESTGKDEKQIDLDAVPAAVREAAQKDVALSHGLALPGLKKLVETKIRNVASKSFGIVVVKAGHEVVSNLTVLDDPVPRDATRRFGTLEEGQTAAVLKVMQNQQRTGPDDTVDLSVCEPPEAIGTAVLEFERALPKNSPVQVTFKLAPDGLLSLHGVDLTTNREVRAEFRTESVMSKEEVAEARSRALTMDVA